MDDLSLWTDDELLHAHGAAYRQAVGNEWLFRLGMRSADPAATAIAREIARRQRQRASPIIYSTGHDGELTSEAHLQQQYDRIEDKYRALEQKYRIPRSFCHRSCSLHVECVCVVGVLLVLTFVHMHLYERFGHA